MALFCLYTNEPKLSPGAIWGLRESLDVNHNLKHPLQVNDINCFHTSHSLVSSENVLRFDTQPWLQVAAVVVPCVCLGQLCLTHTA